MRHDGKLVALEPQVFDVLEYLVRHRDHVVSKDELLAGRWRGHARIWIGFDGYPLNAARMAVNLRRQGEGQRLIKTFLRKGVRFIGTVTEQALQPQRPTQHDQKVTFCRTSDGFNIAMAGVGRGLPLVRATTWLNHIEYEWQDPIRGPLLHFLADRYHLVRYDGRGNGLSDRNVTDISLETFERDLDAVVAANQHSALCVTGNFRRAGPPPSPTVARYPERVTKLVIYGSYAQGRNRRSSVKESETAQAYLTLMRHGWGDENSGFLRAFSSLFVPNASAEDIKAFAQLQRMATTAENAVRLRSACDDLDVLDLLPKVAVPTLVLHARHDRTAPFDEGRRLAALIPNARFVSLESENHQPKPDDPGWPKFTSEIEAFLAS